MIGIGPFNLKRSGVSELQTYYPSPRPLGVCIISTSEPRKALDYSSEPFCKRALPLCYIAKHLSFQIVKCGSLPSHQIAPLLGIPFSDNWTACFIVVCPLTIIRVRDLPLSIGAYHQSFLIAISQPPRLGIEPRLSGLLIIIILVLYGIVSPKLNQTLLR